VTTWSIDVAVKVLEWCDEQRKVADTGVKDGIEPSLHYIGLLVPIPHTNPLFRSHRGYLCTAMTRSDSFLTILARLRL
jgi:hypothetical protein